MCFFGTVLHCITAYVVPQFAAEYSRFVVDKGREPRVMEIFLAVVTGTTNYSTVSTTPLPVFRQAGQKPQPQPQPTISAQFLTGTEPAAY